MIAVINKLKTVTNHVSCECECKFDEAKYNSNQWSNNDKCQCKWKNIHACEQNYVWNPSNGEH